MDVWHGLWSYSFRIETFAIVTHIYTATVQIISSVAAWVTAVPVSRGIPSGEMVAGRKVAVAAFNPSNPADAVIVAVWV